MTKRRFVNKKKTPSDVRTLCQGASALFAALLWLTPHQTAVAVVAGLPDAGTILKGIQAPLPLSNSPKVPELVIDQGIVGMPSTSKAFAVKSIRIIGNREADSATLHALVADAEGKDLTLTQIDELALRITAYYQRQGYPLVEALVPAQVIRDGVVHIRVVLARYGRIALNNRSHVRDALLKATLSSVSNGQDIAQAELDRALLLLSDIPGMAVSATLKPGDQVGTSDLTVGASDTARTSGSAVLDNFGNRYTGQERLGINLHLINPLGLRTGDALTLNGLTSSEQMRYGRLAYESVLNGQGTRLGGSFSALNYRLGGDVTSLLANGSAQIGSLWLRQPLIRSRGINLYGILQHDSLQLRDHIDVNGSQTDRHLANWTLSIYGDSQDKRLSGGSNNWSFGWTQGRVSFDDAVAQLANAASVKSEGRFSKLSASLSRSQRLGNDTSLYLAASGQRASTNLDSSQKMSIGGPFAVRAYESGVVSGDSGELVTAELRHALGPSWGGQLTGVAFLDGARVSMNRNLWTGVTGPNSVLLSGAGIGLQWLGPQQWSARGYVAIPLGTVPTLTGSRHSARGWLETRKSF